MVEQVPLALEFTDGVVRGPADHRSENDSLINERPVEMVARGVAQKVGVAGRIRELVFAVVFVHPRCLEEPAVMIARQERLAVRIEDDEVARRFGKLQHVVAQPDDLGT